MNKPIINDIDVSECAYFNSTTYEEPYCNIDQEYLYTCRSDENCYFKQLKRLQEENEKLKKLKCKFKEYCTCDIEKYRSTLEEIREILMACLEFKTCAKCKFQEKCKWDVEEFILTTINEALNDRD